MHRVHARGNAVALLQHFASQFICLPLVNALYDAFHHFQNCAFIFLLPIAMHFHIQTLHTMYALIAYLLPLSIFQLIAHAGWLCCRWQIKPNH